MIKSTRSYLPSLAIALIAFISISSSYGQGKYLIYLKDKANSPYSLLKPEEYLSPRAIQRRTKQNIPIKPSDLPVSKAYIDSLKKYKADVWYKSKWFNAAYAYIEDSNTVKKIKSLSFVTSVQLLKAGNDDYIIETSSNSKKARLSKYHLESNDYGPSLSQSNQICADVMHQEGYNGEGMIIAVMDGGFTSANRLFFFDSLFKNSKILGTYDFVAKNPFVYAYSDHGIGVLSAIAGYAQGSLIGTGFGASFYLFRTEDGASETLAEEANWLMAAEKADSLGVDIINTSLGYTTFDDPATNHKYSDMNGRTTIISKAAVHAARVGMLCVVSAGNDGNNSWKYIAAPADADSILTVGAIDANFNPARFSSWGPTADGRIKPDVVAQGVATSIGSANNSIQTGNGTSFSAPVMTGMVAGLWQSLPHLTNIEIIEAIRRSGSRFRNPDNKVGFGVPCFNKARLAAYGKLAEISTVVPNPVVNDEPFKVVISPADVGKTVKISIYDVSGKILSEQTFQSAHYSNTLLIPSTGFAPGLYLIKIEGPGVSTVTRLVKQ